MKTTVYLERKQLPPGLRAEPKHNVKARTNMGFPKITGTFLKIGGFLKKGL